MRRLVITVILGVGILMAPFLSSARGDGAEDALPPRPYQSPMRSVCTVELAKDPVWRAKLERTFEAEYQQRWARRFANDRRHVIMAYAALWVLTAVFLAFLWLRQHRLVADIARLEGELERAVAREEGGLASDDESRESD